MFYFFIKLGDLINFIKFTIHLGSLKPLGLELFKFFFIFTFSATDDRRKKI